MIQQKHHQSVWLQLQKKTPHALVKNPSDSSVSRIESQALSHQFHLPKMDVVIWVPGSFMGSLDKKEALKG